VTYTRLDPSPPFLNTRIRVRLFTNLPAGSACTATTASACASGVCENGLCCNPPCSLGIDAGGGTDAATSTDAGALVDAATPMDAGAPIDAGALPDAPGAPDAEPADSPAEGLDAANTDGTSIGASEHARGGGCGCNTGDPSSQASWLWLLVGGALHALRPKRRSE
jgi:MYXO-CTERM domain-containing protein